MGKLVRRFLFDKLKRGIADLRIEMWVHRWVDGGTDVGMDRWIGGWRGGDIEEGGWRE